MNPQPPMFLLGRILMALAFGIPGVTKILGWAATSGWMASKGLPFVPALLIGAIVIEIGGALALLAGYRLRFTALTLALFLLPTTLIFHSFWTVTGLEAQTQQLQFLQNLGVMGGLLVLAALSSRRASTT